MEQLEGSKFRVKKGLLCKLKKSLYGFKQEARQWYKNIDSFMETHGYGKTTSDHYVFVKKFYNNDFIFLLLLCW